MKTIITDVEVPEQLEGLTENQLRTLRDKVVRAGVRIGGVDKRLPRVVEAFQAVIRRKSRKGR